MKTTDYSPLPINALVFDMDGTLVHLHVDWTEVRKEVQALLDMNIDSLWKLAVPPYKEKYLANKEKVDAIFRKYEINADYTPIEEMVQLAKDSPLPINILSNNTEAALKRLAKELGLKPSLIIGRDSVPLPKPHPDGLLIIKQRFSHPLFIGDHPYDMIPAVKTNTAFLSVNLKPENIRRFLLGL